MVGSTTFDRESNGGRLVALLASRRRLWPHGAANTYTVTSTADSGAGSLRQAILDANANPGADTIAFNIVGSGVHTIAPASALPAITDAVTIDGYTQPGSSPNTNPVGQGLNTVLKIEIDGTAAAAGNGLVVAGARRHDPRPGGQPFSGLSDQRVRRYPYNTANLVVEGCFLGTSAGRPAGVSRGRRRDGASTSTPGSAA